MFDPALAIGIFDRLLTTLGLIRDGKRQRNDKTDQALSMLYVALNETKSYAEYLQIGKRRNRKREYQIARLWDDASIPLRYIDKEFAMRCCEKSNYWMSPQVWTNDQIEKKGITLDQMFKITRNLLLIKV
jgi:hypothetical protein